MADTKLSDLTSGTAAATDIIYAVKDPSGTPLDRKVALSSVKDLIVGSGSVSVASGKTLTANNTLTFSGTDSSTLNIGTGGTLAALAYKSSAAISSDVSGLGTGVATFLATPSSANLASAVTDETGSGALVFATSPSLTTPTLGVASATSVNKVAITAPATSATLTIADGKTLTASNTLTLTGTDADSINLTNTATSSIGYTITGNGATITTGVAGTGIRVPFNCTITGWAILADQSGSIVIDIWKDTLANYPPTVADTITASAKPTVTTATSNSSTTLTGWTTSVSAGDVLRFNVDSVTSIQVATIILTVKKT